MSDRATSDDELLARWRRINSAHEALNEILAHETFLGYDPYYKDLRSGMMQMLERVQTSPRRVRHVQRGTTYEVLGTAELQHSGETSQNFHEGGVVEGDVLVVYRSEDGRLWCRPKDEFEDGRFEEISS